MLPTSTDTPQKHRTIVRALEFTLPDEANPQTFLYQNGRLTLLAATNDLVARSPRRARQYDRFVSQVFALTEVEPTKWMKELLA